MPKPPDSQTPSMLPDGELSAANRDPALSLRSLLDQLDRCPRSSLLSILRTDQRKRWQRGERVAAEVYLARLPSLTDEPEVVLDIIFSEIAVREELGERAAPDEYLQRFPHYETQLRRQFLLNQVLGEGDLLGGDPATTAMLPETSAPDVVTTLDLPPPTKLMRDEPADDPGETLPSEAINAGTLPSLIEPAKKTRRRHKPMPIVPGYEILSELGRGGMGVVYKAQQMGLKRLVALKMILSGSHASPQDLARLRSEAEAVAKLRHPNIVQIHEVGEHDGLPFLSLEYIEGGSLFDKLDGAPLTPAQAAFIVERLAHAMHYAHLQGIVHRDLKPANVLLSAVAMGDTLMSGTDLTLRSVDTTVGVPKITDFGLAKSMEGGSGMTNSGAIVGTPSYMAPEQAAGKVHSIGPCTDVYALGAILYELLTGRPPFRAATAMDTVLQVLSVDPVPPTRLQPKVPPDLENICLKCLHKEPPRRYPTALALADDLCAYRENRPVSARPVGMWERLRKWAHRNPTIAASIGIITFVTVIGFALVFWKWQEARTANAVAQAALAQAKVSLYFNRIALAEREWSANDVIGVQKLLENAPPELRHWEWYYLKQLCAGGPTAAAGKDCVAVSPDNRWLASVQDQAVKVWDRKGNVWLTFDKGGHTSRVNHVAFSADSTRLASASDDMTVKVWNLATGALERTLTQRRERDELSSPVRSVAFQPGGKLLAGAIDDETVRLWDWTSGQELRVLTGHNGEVTSVAFSADGQRLASASSDKTIRLWNPADGELKLILRGHDDRVNMIAFAPEGRLLVSAGKDHTVKLWDAEKDQPVLTLRGHDSSVNCVAFGPDGRVASGSGDYLKPGDVKVWNATTGQPLHTYRWPTQEVTGLAFSSDGKWLASADARSVILWDATNDQESRSLRAHKEGVMAVAFSPTGPFLASAGEDGILKVWDWIKEEVIHDCAGHIKAINVVVYSPDGTQIITASDDRTLKVWDSTTGMLRHTLEGHTTTVFSVAVSPDGKVLASSAFNSSTPGEVKLWDLATGKEIKTLDARAVRHLAFSPDGKRLAACADHPFRVVVWDLASGAEVFQKSDFRQWISAVVFSPDGHWLAASGGSDKEGVIRLWNATTGEEHKPIRTRTGRVGSIAFSPDGQRIVAASWDHTLKLFDPLSGQDVLTLRGHTDGVTGVAFSADGWRMASASLDKTVKLWSAASATEPPTQALRAAGR